MTPTCACRIPEKAGIDTSTCIAVLLIFLATNAGWAAPVELPRQAITLPPNADAPIFADVDGAGRCDLLVLDPVEKKLLNYHQRPDGFSNSPDQVILLPPQTAWVAVCDVDAHPGLELLFSTANGLVYSRQNAGLFESERRTLIQASQPFTNFDFPVLTLLSTNKDGTTALIPVISGGHALLYKRNSSYEWSPGPPLILDAKQTVWHVNRHPWHDSWTIGPHPAHSLNVEQSFRATTEPERDNQPENDTIRKIIADMKANPAGWRPGMARVDVDGDGREDLVLWQGTAKLDFKTDIYIFLRGADQKLPERPSQVLHCSGFPIPIGSIGSTYRETPVHDLDGDGVCELVLLEPTTVFTSPSGLVKTALTHGVDCSITIRSFHRGAFSRSPDASVPVTILLTLDELTGWPFCIQGDFNGDGRPDLLIRRSETQWNIYLSTTDKRWFAPEPAMTFNAPSRGYLQIQDLNGDGLADIIWHELDGPNLSIFMSSARQSKGKNP